MMFTNFLFVVDRVKSIVLHECVKKIRAVEMYEDMRTGSHHIFED
jgi:hypothetical protein